MAMVSLHRLCGSELCLFPDSGRSSVGGPLPAPSSAPGLADDGNERALPRRGSSCDSRGGRVGDELWRPGPASGRCV